MEIQGNTFTIRALQGAGAVPDEADLEAVLSVYRQCEDFLALGPIAKASLAMVQADLVLSHEEGGIYCGVYDRQEEVLMAVVDFVPSGFRGDPNIAYLSLVMVAAPYRRSGLGRAIVEAVEEEILRDGRARVIELGVQVNNPDALRFWQRLGYRIISPPELLPDGTICRQMRKEI